MAQYEKAKDVFIQRRTTSGGFEEYALIVQPNSAIITDVNNNLVFINTASLVGTGSGTTLSTGSFYPITSSWSVSASFASSSLSSSFAITASYFNQLWLSTGSLYPITSSWALSSSFPWRTVGTSSFCSNSLNIGGTNSKFLTKVGITVPDNTTALELWTPNITAQVALNIITPLSTDSSTGKAFAFSAGNEGFARGLFYSDGAYGIGDGVGVRDVYLGRSSAGVISITSDKVSGRASLMVSNITASRITASTLYVYDSSGNNTIITVDAASTKASLFNFKANGGLYSTTFGLAGAANQIFTGVSAGDFAIRAADDQKLHLGVHNGSINTPAMTLLESGNVGIGTTSPQTRLHVNGPISASSFGSGSLFGTASYADNALSSSFPWQSNGSASICLQRIGIGTNVPKSTASDNFIYTSGNSVALEINAPNLTTVGAFGIYLPLSTDINSGKAFAFTAGNEVSARGIFYSDGAYGIGDGTNPRDVYLGRSSAGVISITSDKVSGRASLMVSNITASRITASAGLLGTASYANNALSSSYITASNVIGTVNSASYALTSSYALNGGGSSTQTLQLPVYSAKMSGSSINAAETNWELRFPINSSAIWQFRMPENYASDLKNTIQFYPTQSQTGTQTIGWRMDLTHISSGTTQSVYTILPQLKVSVTHSLDTNQSASWLREESVYLTGSNLQSGDLVIYKLLRISGSSDTSSGSIAVVSNILQWITE
jgi:hypothetical protein